MGKGSNSKTIHPYSIAIATVAIMAMVGCKGGKRYAVFAPGGGGGGERAAVMRKAPAHVYIKGVRELRSRTNRRCHRA